MPSLSVHAESFPLREAFTISRGSKTDARVVRVDIVDGDRRGRGECVPYPRYDESMESVLDQIEAVRARVEAGIEARDLQALLPAGAARNALDCALWDLRAKQAGVRAWDLAGLPAPEPVVTAYTLSLDAPERMRAAAERNAGRALLKLKLGGEDIVERVAAVREGAPRARLIVDANEAWSADSLARCLPELARLGVELVEQPLPAGADAALEELESPVPLGADESCHTRGDLETAARRYQVVNVKLDKAGGLTEALALARAAADAGLGLMVGCMVGTSLAMAPALLLTRGAAFVDLDGPLLLAEDRNPPLTYAGSLVHPPEPALWG